MVSTHTLRSNTKKWLNKLMTVLSVCAFERDIIVMVSSHGSSVVNLNSQSKSSRWPVLSQPVIAVVVASHYHHPYFLPVSAREEEYQREGRCCPGAKIETVAR
jgi:hypothetical protein